MMISQMNLVKYIFLVSIFISITFATDIQCTTAKSCNQCLSMVSDSEDLPCYWCYNTACLPAANSSACRSGIRYYSTCSLLQNQVDEFRHELILTVSLGSTIPFVVTLCFFCISPIVSSWGLLFIFTILKIISFILGVILLVRLDSIVYSWLIFFITSPVVTVLVSSGLYRYGFRKHYKRFLISFAFFELIAVFAFFQFVIYFFQIPMDIDFDFPFLLGVLGLMSIEFAGNLAVLLGTFYLFLFPKSLIRMEKHFFPRLHTFNRSRTLMLNDAPYIFDSCLLSCLYFPKTLKYKLYYSPNEMLLLFRLGTFREDFLKEFVRELLTESVYLNRGNNSTDPRFPDFGYQIDVAKKTPIQAISNFFTNFLFVCKASCLEILERDNEYDAKLTASCFLYCWDFGLQDGLKFFGKEHIFRLQNNNGKTLGKHILLEALANSRIEEISCLAQFLREESEIVLGEQFQQISFSEVALMTLLTFWRRGFDQQLDEHFYFTILTKFLYLYFQNITQIEHSIESLGILINNPNQAIQSKSFVFFFNFLQNEFKEVYENRKSEISTYAEDIDKIFIPGGVLANLLIPKFSGMFITEAFIRENYKGNDLSQFTTKWNSKHPKSPLPDALIAASYGSIFQRSSNEIRLKGKLPNKFDEIFSVEKVLGEGTYGVVSLVIWKSDPDRKFAMKEGRSINLQNEGKLSEITHYNVIRLQGFYFKDDGNQVLLMEYMRGGTLANSLLSIQPQQKVMKQLIDAIDYLHSNGIVHRDLKPLNVLLEHPTPHWEKIVVCDFGFAHDHDKSGPKVAGTLRYLPEKMEKWKRIGSNKEPLDIWALGCIFYELLKASYRVVGKNNPLEDEVFKNFGKWETVSRECNSEFAKIFKICWDNPNEATVQNLKANFNEKAHYFIYESKNDSDWFQNSQSDFSENFKH